ncbi:MAG TPA: hypothetical protein VMM76_12010 [Pirellulaceae bacterium]|nr:hypothetical protein [Pirellulaceae bacterium]
MHQTGAPNTRHAYWGGVVLERTLAASSAGSEGFIYGGSGRLTASCFPRHIDT